MLQKARLEIDDIFKIYDRPWEQGEATPAGLADVPAGTVFMVPSPSSSRGLVNKTVQVLRSPAFKVLEFFNDTCAVVIGMGHDP